jgi:hypothetical protein
MCWATFWATFSQKTSGHPALACAKASSAKCPANQHNGETRTQKLFISVHVCMEVAFLVEVGRA